jgi:hypothetical protein
MDHEGCLLREQVDHHLAMINEGGCSDKFVAFGFPLAQEEGFDRLSRDQLMPIFSLAEANARKQPPPGLAQLQQQRRVLERSLLHPALRK